MTLVTAALLLTFEQLFAPAEIDAISLSPAIGSMAPVEWPASLPRDSYDAKMASQDRLDGGPGLRLVDEGRTLIAFSSRGRDARALVAIDVKTGAENVLAMEDGVDLSEALLDASATKAVAYVRHGAKREWIALDPEVRKDFEKINAEMKRRGGEELRVLSRSLDGGAWTVAFDRTDGPARYLMYRRGGKLVDLGVASEAQAKLKLSRLEPIPFRTSDGIELVSYLALPPGRPAQSLPMIVVIHGGPESERAASTNSPIVQLFTDRGYAVLAADFRGSAGRGRKFRELQNDEWGGALNRDVVEQVQALVKRGMVDARRVGILGASYGGYHTLAAMAFSPDVFACGYAAAAPANLEKFDAPIAAALRRARSPVNFADRIRGPLVIIHGGRDTEVLPIHTEEMAAALRRAGKPFTYLRYPDEGHGFESMANLVSFLAIAESFFGQCLGGRSAGIGEALGKSSVEVLEGAERIPGLAGK